MNKPQKKSFLLKTYSRLDVTMKYGIGSWLFDDNGFKYLDALSGIAVNTLGHSHPKLVSALNEQVNNLIHTSNLYKIPLQEELAEKLTRVSGLDLAFFCNSGLEANEAAIKIARKYGNSLGYLKPEVIVFEKAFHGRSIATISASSNKKMQQGFEPLLEGFIRAPINDIEAIKDIGQKHKEICAVFIETIQGEGGINIPEKKFLQELENLSLENGWLLILDEVQCGMGRTGKWFAYQWNGLSPDIVPIAKGLGSGVPIGAVLLKKSLASLMPPGSHGSTFGGNPLAMRAGLETLNIIEKESLLKNAQVQGKKLKEDLHNRLSKLNELVEIRGKGLMLGVELNKPCQDVVKIAIDNGLLINVTESNIIRILPPLTITNSEIDFLTETLVNVIYKFLEKN